MRRSISSSSSFSASGRLGGCLSIFGGTGCFGLIFSMLIGGWLLQYDLNFWVPRLHAMWPQTFANHAPYALFPWCFLLGIILFEVSIPVALITFILSVFGVLA